jgi:hypothetical protein
MRGIAADPPCGTWWRRFHLMDWSALLRRTSLAQMAMSWRAWLLSSLLLGCNGLLSGSGSVIADRCDPTFRCHGQDGQVASIRFTAPTTSLYNLTSSFSRRDYVGTTDTLLIYGFRS